MKRIAALLFTSICILFISCKDDQDPADRHCWQVVDAMGNDLVQVCGRTEAELLLCAENGTCGNFSPGTILTQCSYYQKDAPTFCYSFNGNYVGELTESQAALYSRCFFGGIVPQKVTCLNCAFWFHRIKRTGKASGNSIFENVRREQFCGDTLATLFQGRQVILKDDADSLVVRQFSNNGTNW